MASQSQGGYVEAGYDLLRVLAPGNEQSVTLFGRFDYADTQASVPAGFVANPAFRRTIYTVGRHVSPGDADRAQARLPAARLRRRRPSGNELAAAITWMF